MLTSKALFDEVKGFDEQNFAMEYNDVDYCLRLARANKRIVFTPQAELVHHCGKSRGVGFRPREHTNFLTRYAGIEDRFYNKSLDADKPIMINPRHFVHVDRIANLKALFVSHNLNLEGAPRILFDRASGFAAAEQSEMVVVSPVDGPLRQQYEAAGIPVRIIDNPLSRIAEDDPGALIEGLRSISLELEASSFDVIIANTLHSFWAVLVAKLLNRPVIWNIHESVSVKTFFPFSPGIIELIQNCLGRADRVVFEASATRTIFDRHERHDNFTTIPGSVDVGSIRRFRRLHSRESLREQHKIHPDATVVSLIGTTCARKGQHVFVQAIRKLQTERGIDQRTVFLMVGARKSAYLDFLRDQLDASGVKNTFLVEERDDVYEFFCLSDIFVCASYQESFPRVLLEAMAFKLGIVSTDIFGIPEMISHGDEGLLVRPGDVEQLADGILQLVQKPDLRRQLAARAHSKVTRLFDSKKQLRKHLELTKEIVARHQISEVKA
jgi:glycosyltransferase involved in cell wall biosynthesis